MIVVYKEADLFGHQTDLSLHASVTLTCDVAEPLEYLHTRGVSEWLKARGAWDNSYLEIDYPNLLASEPTLLTFWLPLSHVAAEFEVEFGGAQ